MNEEQMPEAVRRVAGPAVRWQMQFGGYTFDGYVFEDDPSDLARFIRWQSQDQTQRVGQIILTRMPG